MGDTRFTGEAVDLIAAGSLPAAWAKKWARNPQAPVLLDYSHGDLGTATAQSSGTVDEAPQWITAGELDALTRGAALQFAAAGVVRATAS